LEGGVWERGRLLVLLLLLLLLGLLGGDDQFRVRE
jgi:hypothetical protein